MVHQERMNDLYGPPVTLQDLCNNVFKYANDHFLKKTKLLGWGMKVTHSESISNAHYRPHNGVYNWNLDNDIPKGYPGWSGRVWIFYDRQRATSGDPPLFENLRLYTGSGGYGFYSCSFLKISMVRSSYYPLSYHFTFFEADWPSLILGEALGEDNKKKQTAYTLEEGFKWQAR